MSVDTLTSAEPLVGCLASVEVNWLNLQQFEHWKHKNKAYNIKKNCQSPEENWAIEKSQVDHQSTNAIFVIGKVNGHKNTANEAEHQADLLEY